MKTRLLKKQIKKLITETELERAFELLRVLYANRNEDLYKEVIVLQGQYKHLRSHRNLSMEYELRELKKIVAAMQQLNKDLGKEYQRIVPPEIVQAVEPMLPVRN